MFGRVETYPTVEGKGYKVPFTISVAVQTIIFNWIQVQKVVCATSNQTIPMSLRCSSMAARNSKRWYERSVMRHIRYVLPSNSSSNSYTWPSSTRRWQAALDTSTSANTGEKILNMKMYLPDEGNVVPTGRAPVKEVECALESVRKS